MNNIAITADSICDLPKKLLEEYDIDIIYYEIETEKGVFKDSLEMSPTNVFEYLDGGLNKAESHESSTSDYKKFFMSKLENYSDIIHFCLSSETGDGIKNANLARAQLGIEGQKIHIIDSLSLSCGTGMLAVKAAKLRDEGNSAREIVNQINTIKETVYTSFIAKNADYLYYNNRASKRVMMLCKKLNMHPVLHMKKGKLVLKTVYFGNYEKACKRYIKSTLSRSSNIDKSLAYLVYAGVSFSQLEKFETYINTIVPFDHIYTQSASAAVSANCGPGSIGIFTKTYE